MQLSKSIFLLLLNLKLWRIAADEATSLPKQSRCERLKTSLTYSQANAPQDISAVLPLIVERVNRELNGVVDVEVLFTGSEIHRRVGKHTVQCSVTRLLSTAEGSTEDDENATDADVVPADLDFQTKGKDEQGRDVVTQCFLVPFTILDVDECNLPHGHILRHQCAEPAMCVNTQGSYECLCPSSQENHLDISLASSEDDTVVSRFWNDIAQSEITTRFPWEKSLSSTKKSSCPAKASTHDCCDSNAHSDDGSTCRSQFKCPVDPCIKSGKDGNNCVSGATCVKAETPLDLPSYTCECPSGLMGNGHECRRGIDVMPPAPKVKFDGVTPTDETVQNRFYCGCTKPIIDHCSGYDKCTGKNEMCAVSEETMEPHCVCKPRYVYVESFGCVDESPPTLKLRNDDDEDGITHLKQGDTYKEYAVDVMDANAEDYKRSLKIAYSRPLPDGCETKIGSFQVNYTVAMPWTNPPYARVTRNVIIEDIDECQIDISKYEFQCPQIIPHCDVDHGAVCQNTNGSYTCKCPKFTTGDGFQFISSKSADNNNQYIDAPEGYNGGTGCTDTSKPIIEVLGPNPKIFRTPKSGGLSGVMRKSKRDKNNEFDASLLSKQRDGYDADIKAMIVATSGAELCATYTRSNPLPVNCVRATDHTYLGNVDLSSKVTVGNPEKVSLLEWKVPYNVMDEAGNAATTVWRHLLVEEVDLWEIEEKIRAGVLADKDVAIQKAVERALVVERSKQTNIAVPNESKNSACPACPSCECKTGNTEYMKQCEVQLQQLNSECEQAINNSNKIDVQQIFEAISSFAAEAMLSTQIIVAVLVLMVIIQCFRMYSSGVNGNGWHVLNETDIRQEEEMLTNVTYFSPEGSRRHSNGFSPPLNTSFSRPTTSPMPGTSTSPMPRTSSSPMPTGQSPFSPPAAHMGNFHRNTSSASSLTPPPQPLPTASFLSPESRRNQSNGHSPNNQRYY